MTVNFWQKIAHVNGTQNRQGLSFILQAQNSPDEIKNFLLINYDLIVRRLLLFLRVSPLISELRQT